MVLAPLRSARLAPLLALFAALLALLIAALLALLRVLLAALLLFPPGGLVVLDDFAFVHLAAPALNLIGMQHRLGHHVPGDVLELQARPPSLRPPDVGRLLEEPLRVILQDHDDAGQLR